MIVNKKSISRLSRYRKALFRFKELGFVKVFSDTLGEAVGVTASQVRKDFSLFGIPGNKRGGYQIDTLIDKLQNILGKDYDQKVIIVGIGNIGNALIKYKGFEREGIKIVAGFDIDPAKVNKKSTVPIYPLDEIHSYVKRHGITIGIIAVPEIVAQEVCDKMISAGIKGILNFAPLRYKGAENAMINNVNLQAELENVIYFVNVLKHKK
ncbi:redox-sensing transcriptional repressor Rex [bacterium]|nr:redox-sensing transcriptional repressor Rex [bacterium]